MQQNTSGFASLGRASCQLESRIRVLYPPPLSHLGCGSSSVTAQPPRGLTLVRISGRLHFCMVHQVRQVSDIP